LIIVSRNYFKGGVMTDQEKVNKMFEIRKKELPDHSAESIKRISGMLSPAFGAYWGLLQMYNERFPDKKIPQE
jgi:hypothetical protein